MVFLVMINSVFFFFYFLHRTLSRDSSEIATTESHETREEEWTGIMAYSMFSILITAWQNLSQQNFLWSMCWYFLQGILMTDILKKINEKYHWFLLKQTDSLQVSVSTPETMCLYRHWNMPEISLRFPPWNINIMLLSILSNWFKKGKH